MKGVVERIGLVFKAGWQWLTAAPRYRGALLCGLSVLGAMVFIGYNGNKGVFARSPPTTQANDVVAARISAMSHASGASNAESSLPNGRSGDADVVESSPVRDDSAGAKSGPSARAIASDKSFLVADTEKQKAANRDKKEVKKTANKPKKQTPPPPASNDRDRKFNPSQDIKRAGETITRVFRDLF
jgi:hypothetical protein